MAWTADQPDRRGSGDTVSWKGYVDAVFEEHRRQVDAALIAHDSRVLANKEAITQRLEILNDSLIRLMEGGDDALKQHLIAQDVAVSAALTSVDKRLVDLHQEMVLRDSSVRDLLVAETRSGDTRVRESFAASEKAIEKAEAASEKRFDSVNAFREQLAKQSSQFLPREVADTQFAELRKLISLNTERLDINSGNSQGSTASTAQIMLIIGLIISVAAILVGAYT